MAFAQISRDHTSRSAGRAPVPRTRDAQVQIWLVLLALLILLIVTVGGATRLTGSGLSITEWNLIGGVVPPLTEAQWQAALQQYRAIPQYQVINRGMSLEAFKTIFWWEWAHRMLGRLIGLVALVPLVIWTLRGALSGWLRRRSVLIFLGVCAQGALGWWMVKSGLTERTEVSQYRLMAHLCLAFALLGLIVWTLADVRAQSHRDTVHSVALDTVPSGQRWLGVLIAPLIFIQIALGALVAGMKAGLMFNTWPLMGDQVVPSGLAAMTPWWRNVFENATTVQFNHRTFGIIVAVLVIWHAIKIVQRADDAGIRSSAYWLGALVIGQFALGVWTLVAGVPIGLALAHQAVAALLLSAAVWHAHGLIRR